MDTPEIYTMVHLEKVQFGSLEIPNLETHHVQVPMEKLKADQTLGITPWRSPNPYRAEIKPIHGVSCAIYFYLGVIGFRVYPYMHWLTFSRQNIKNMADQPKRTPHPEVRETFIFGGKPMVGETKP